MTKKLAPFGVTLAVLAAGTLLSPSPAAAADLQTQVIVSNCYVCHGPAGKTAGHTPRLNNQTAAKVQEAMTQFASGDKPSTIMNRIATGFSPEQIKVIADHIGAMNQMQ